MNERKERRETGEKVGMKTFSFISFTSLRHHFWQSSHFIAFAAFVCSGLWVLKHYLTFSLVMKEAWWWFVPSKYSLLFSFRLFDLLPVGFNLDTHSDRVLQLVGRSMKGYSCLIHLITFMWSNSLSDCEREGKRERCEGLNVCFGRRLLVPPSHTHTPCHPTHHFHPPCFVIPSTSHNGQIFIKV